MFSVLSENNEKVYNLNLPKHLFVLHKIAYFIYRLHCLNSQPSYFGKPSIEF